MKIVNNNRKMKLSIKTNGFKFLKITLEKNQELELDNLDWNLNNSTFEIDEVEKK